MMLVFLAILTAFSIGSIFYVILDLFGGEGRIDSKIRHRLEHLLVRRAPSIMNQPSFSSIAGLHEVLKRQALSKSIYQLLILSGWNMPLSMFIVMDLIWGCIIYAIVNMISHSFFIALVAALIMASIPYIFLVINKRRYIEKFTVHFPEALIMMKSALKAGQGMQAAFQVVADDGPKPVSTEISYLVREIELGTPFSEALNGLYQRIQTLDLRLFVLGIHIQNEVGGNLVELFDHVENTIRDRISLAREIKVLSAQGKMTGMVLMGLPIAVVMIVTIGNPGFFNPLLQEELGKLLIWLAVGFQLFGSYVVHRITHFRAVA